VLYNNTLKQIKNMIHFFGNTNSKIFAVQTPKELSQKNIQKLNWLFGNKQKLNKASIGAFFIGPRAAMVTPWSTNAVEITQNMGIKNILRIEVEKSNKHIFTNQRGDFYIRDGNATRSLSTKEYNNFKTEDD